MSLQRLLRYGTVAVAATIVAAGVAISTSTPTLDQTPQACNELRIPSVGITRCVVGGGQAQIDAGNVVRFTSLSSENVDWLAGHRTSHGGTFRALTGIRIGHKFTWEGRTYTVTNADVVNRNNPGYVLGWTTSATPTVVLQTSKSGSDVYVWRAVADGSTAPAVTRTTAPPPPPPVTDTQPAGSAVNFDIITPTRILDTRQSTHLKAGTWTPVSLGNVANGATVAAINVAAVPRGQAGYVTVDVCANANGTPKTSSVNFYDWRPVANLALVGINGRSFCAYAHVDVDVVFDVVATGSTQATQKFTPLTPQRVIDTRTEPGQLVGGQTTRVQTGNVGAAGVAATLTTISDGDGWVVAHPCNVAATTSSVNTRTGVPTANQVWVELNAAGEFCVTSNMSGDVIVDVTGTFSADGANSYQPLASTRLIDTRISNSDDWNRGLRGSGLGYPLSTIDIPAAGTRGIPAASGGLALNVTSTGVVVDGFLTVFPCDTPMPNASVLNPRVGATAGASTTAATPAGRSCIFSHGIGHVVVDLVGVWVPAP